MTQRTDCDQQGHEFAYWPGEGPPRPMHCVHCGVFRPAQFSAEAVEQVAEDMHKAFFADRAMSSPPQWEKELPRNKGDFRRMAQKALARAAENPQWLYT